MVTITTTTPTQSVFTALSGKNYYPVTLTALISESNPALTRVGATLNWNDGSPLTVFTPGGAISVNTTRNLAIGTYFITLTAFNYAQPQPQQTSLYFSVQVQPQQIIAAPQDYIFGPILPLDNGFPNAAQWNFNLGTDLAVLASSVKMLLITNKGERIMLPAYGTRLRRVIFEPSTSSVNSIIQQEITDAVTQFEPRVVLTSFDVEKTDPDGKSIIVNATFLSKISQASFSLSIPVNQ
jgi:phage baseplate assembly protein W